MIKQYIKYRSKARNAHGIHSPYVFDLFKNVLAKSKNRDDRPIHWLKRELRRKHEKIEVTDLGAGSKKNNATQRSISSIAKTASMNRKYGKFLAEIIDYYEMEYIIELGTSLGIGTAYLSSPSKVKKVVTLEGSKNIQALAKENLRQLKRENVEFLEGEFSDLIEEAVESVPRIDMVLIDGNHTYEATIKYFNYFFEHAHNNTFLVFDDINWSPGMQKAWEEIKNNEKINVSMELFRMGMVIKRDEQVKENFVLRF